MSSSRVHAIAQAVSRHSHRGCPDWSPGQTTWVGFVIDKLAETQESSQVFQFSPVSITSLVLLNQIFIHHKHHNLTFIGPWIFSIFAEYNQQDATFLNLFISVRRSTCFRRVFPSIIRSLKLHIQLLAAGSSIGLTKAWSCMCTFELLTMEGKTVWNM